MSDDKRILTDDAIAALWRDTGLGPDVADMERGQLTRLIHRLLADRAARREREAADVALMRRADDYIKHQPSCPENASPPLGRCTCGANAVSDALRARIGGG